MRQRATQRSNEPETGPIRRLLESRWTRRVENVVFLALLAFILYRIGPQLSALTGIGPAVGSAPTFEVVTLEGDTLTDDGLDGRVAVINFWATWCLPCRLEMPALQALREAHDPDDVLVLGIATDVTGPAAVRRFLRERGITYPVAMADRRSRLAFGGISAIPTTFIVDRDGVIRHRVLGLFAPPAMNAAVRRLVGAPGDTLASPAH